MSLVLSLSVCVQMAGKDILQRKFADITDHLTIIGDGVDLTPRIRAQRLEAICFLNIPSHGAGTNPWGTPPSRDPVSMGLTGETRQ